METASFSVYWYFDGKGFIFPVVLASGFPSVKSMMCKFGDIKGVPSVLNMSVFISFQKESLWDPQQ